jgi:nucleoside-diphosphate-sugar epimerase
MASSKHGAFFYIERILEIGRPAPIERLEHTMRALVTGATGMIGPALVNRLLAEGWNVRILVRRSFDPEFFAAPVERLNGDVADAHSLRPAMEGIDVVFHLAAKLHLNNPSPNQSQEYRRINVDGAMNVAVTAVDVGIKRMVHFSTVSVYGPSYGLAPYTETSPLNPQSLYAETKMQSEAGILNIFKGNPRSSAVVLRLAAVYGPRLQGNYRTLVKALQHGFFCPVGNGQNRRTMIYIDDLVRAAILAAEHPKAAGMVFNITDGEIHTLNEVLKAIACALGKTPPRFHFPSEPMQAFSAIVDRFTNSLRLPAPKLRLLVDKMMEDVAVSGDKFCRQLSFHPRYDIKHGWQAALSNRKKRSG